jgi:hypothetical protein
MKLDNATKRKSTNEKMSIVIDGFTLTIVLESNEAS